MVAPYNDRASIDSPRTSPLATLSTYAEPQERFAVMPHVVFRSTTVTTRPGSPGAIPFPAWVPWATIGAFLLAALTTTWNSVTFGGIQISDLFLLVSVGAITVQFAFGGLRFHVPGWLWAPIGALLLCVFARVVSPVPDAYFSLRYQTTEVIPGSVGKAAFWALALIGVPLAAIACSALKPQAPKWIAVTFVAGVTLSSAVALTDLAGLTHISTSLGYESNNIRQVGLAGHPTTLGLVGVIATPLAIHFIASLRLRWLACAALLILGGGVLASGSRGAQALFPLAALVAVLLSPLRRRLLKWFTLTGLGTAAAGAIAIRQWKPDAFDEIFRFRGSGGGGASDSDRGVLARQALDDFIEFPVFGLGIRHINEAHSIYLEVIAAGGLVLAIAMLVYWGGAVRDSWRARRHLGGLGLALLASLSVWLGLGAIQNQLTDRYLYYTVGCIAAMTSLRKSEDSEGPGLQRGRTDVNDERPPQNPGGSQARELEDL